MKVFKVILFIILGLGALVVIGGLIAPKEFNVERSVVIQAPSPMIHRHIAFQELQNTWSVWAQMDPDQKTSMQGEDGQVGYVYSWDGEITGQGSQELTSLSPERIEYKLIFTDPWESEALAYYNIAESDSGTQVALGIAGSMPFPMNAMTLFGDMGMGNDFQTSLNSLKEKTEALAADKSYRGYDIKVVDIPATRMLGIRQRISMADMGSFYTQNLRQIYSSLARYNPSSPSGLYFEWNPQEGMTDMAAALMVDVSAPKGKFEEFTLSGQAIQVDYLGAYEKSEDAHYAIDDYLKDYGAEMKYPVWEEYVTDPMTEPDTSKWLTRITYFIQ